MEKEKIIGSLLQNIVGILVHFKGFLLLLAYDI